VPLCPCNRLTVPLANRVNLRTIVASKLILNWSPEQISGWLKGRYPNNESMRVSHETIYRSLFIQARGVLKKIACSVGFKGLQRNFNLPNP
jgi:IS30 family transposase